MKTPEEMAIEWLKEEYGDTSNWTYAAQEMSLDAFYAGYQAAKLESMMPKTDIVGDALNSSAARHAVALLGYADKMTNSSNNSNGWISVKDRLPNSTPMVLAMCTDGYELAYYGNYGEGRWTNTLGTEHLNVTHWMPLPKAPKEEK